MSRLNNLTKMHGSIPGRVDKPKLRTMSAERQKIMDVLRKKFHEVFIFIIIIIFSLLTTTDVRTKVIWLSSCQRGAANVYDEVTLRCHSGQRCEYKKMRPTFRLGPLRNMDTLIT